MDGDAVDTGSRRELLAVEQPVRQPQRRRARVRARRLPLHRPGRRRRRRRPGGQRPGHRRRCWARSCASTPTAPTGGHAYGIPADNPFADGAGRRAPRSGSTGCATRGASPSTAPPATCGSPTSARTQCEEIDLLPAGRRRRAGAPTSAGTRWRAPTPTTAAATPTAACCPVFEYGHDEGCSVTGGFVYRGAAIPGSAARTCSPTTARATCGRCGCDDGQVTDERTFDAHVDGDWCRSPRTRTDAGEVYVLSLTGRDLPARRRRRAPSRRQGASWSAPTWRTARARYALASAAGTLGEPAVAGLARYGDRPTPAPSGTALCLPAAGAASRPQPRAGPPAADHQAPPLVDQDAADHQRPAGRHGRDERGGQARGGPAATGWPPPGRTARRTAATSSSDAR